MSAAHGRPISVAAVRPELAERAAGDGREARVAPDRPEHGVDVVLHQLKAVRVCVELRFRDPLRADVAQRHKGFVSGGHDAHFDPAQQGRERISALDREPRAASLANIRHERRREGIGRVLEQKPDAGLGRAVQDTLRLVVHVGHAEIRIDDANAFADRLEDVEMPFDGVGGRGVGASGGVADADQAHAADEGQTAADERRRPLREKRHADRSAVGARSVFIREKMSVGRRRSCGCPTKRFFPTGFPV